MTFIYSLKLFKSNFSKALKLFLCYLVIWGVCICLLLPVFFEFSSLIKQCFADNNLIDALSGVFGGSAGLGLRTLFLSICSLVVDCWTANVGLMVYALIVIFLILPLLLSISNYTFCEMLNSYMSSKTKIGFFSALVKGLKKSVLYALDRTFFGLIFYAILFACVYGLSLAEGAVFENYVFPIALLVLLIVLYVARRILTLGTLPALIVFDCSLFTARHKGLKAVSRHLPTTFMTTFSYFVVFWVLVMVFGAFSLVALIPLMSILMSNYNMVAFYCSQGMRFYFDNDHILTPKKLEEVDNIKKISAIL